MDWDDLRYFLMVARHRTLSAAAHEIGVTQPTVGRRISALELRLGAKLFDRRSDGFVLSESGARLLDHAARMEQDAIGAERRVLGRDEGVRGTVRVTASEWVVTSVLMPLVGALASRHAELTVELMADTRHLNLARREADIALRPRRFEHDAVVQRATAKLGFGVYASRAYLATHGAPTPGDGEGHTLIAMTDDVGDVARTWLETALPRARVIARTNGRDAMTTFAASGAGLACLAHVVGDGSPALEHIAMPGAPSPTLWLGVHRDARAIPRVRAVASFFAERLRKLKPRLLRGGK